MPPDITPDAVFRVILALPDTLSMRVRRTAVRNAIQRAKRAAGLSVAAPGEEQADIESVLGEAALQKAQRLQRLQQLDTEQATERQALEAQIALLQVQITQLPSQFIERQKAIEEEMEQLDKVIEFLGVDMAGPAVAPARFTPEDEDDLPPHLRADTASRLLGLEN